VHQKDILIFCNAHILLTDIVV